MPAHFCSWRSIEALMVADHNELGVRAVASAAAEPELMDWQVATTGGNQSRKVCVRLKLAAAAPNPEPQAGGVHATGCSIRDDQRIKSHVDRIHCTRLIAKHLGEFAKARRH